MSENEAEELEKDEPRWADGEEPWWALWVYDSDAPDDYAELHRILAVKWDWSLGAVGGVGTIACRPWIELGVEVPGVLGRLGAPRCRECCRIAGVAEGAGNPHNDRPA